MKASDYAIKVTTPFIIIFDLDLGGKSVTNDIDKIIAELSNRYCLNLDVFSSAPNGMILIYRDSEGEYARVVRDKNGIGFDTYPGHCFEKLGLMYLESLYNESE